MQRGVLDSGVGNEILVLGMAIVLQTGHTVLGAGVLARVLLIIVRVGFDLIVENSGSSEQLLNALAFFDLDPSTGIAGFFPFELSFLGVLMIRIKFII